MKAALKKKDIKIKKKKVVKSPIKSVNLDEGKDKENQVKRKFFKSRSPKDLVRRKEAVATMMKEHLTFGSKKIDHRRISAGSIKVASNNIIYENANTTPTKKCSVNVSRCDNIVKKLHEKNVRRSLPLSVSKSSYISDSPKLNKLRSKLPTQTNTRDLLNTLFDDDSDQSTGSPTASDFLFSKKNYTGKVILLNSGLPTSPLVNSGVQDKTYTKVRLKNTPSSSPRRLQKDSHSKRRSARLTPLKKNISRDSDNASNISTETVRGSPCSMLSLSEKDTNPLDSSSDESTSRLFSVFTTKSDGKSAKKTTTEKNSDVPLSSPGLVGNVLAPGKIFREEEGKEQMLLVGTIFQTLFCTLYRNKLTTN